MGENTNIQWADHTFNPWIGCTKVSAACDHCYAEAWARRFGGEWGPHAPRHLTNTWRSPVLWNRRAEKEGRRYRVFCASLADVFDNHRSIMPEWRGRLWGLIQRTPHLDWLLLTKRPQNIAQMLPEGNDLPAWGPEGWPNVWLGTTVENQTEADRRIPALLSVPAAGHFISAEPLLEPISIRPYFHDSDCALGGGECTCRDDGGPFEYTIRWVIAGGESGRGCRPTEKHWLTGLRDQCLDAGVPFFFKQWGGTTPRAVHANGNTLDGRVWEQHPFKFGG